MNFILERTKTEKDIRIIEKIHYYFNILIYINNSINVYNIIMLLKMNLIVYFHFSIYALLFNPFFQRILTYVVIKIKYYVFFVLSVFHKSFLDSIPS